MICSSWGQAPNTVLFEGEMSRRYKSASLDLLAYSGANALGLWHWHERGQIGDPLGRSREGDRREGMLRCAPEAQALQMFDERRTLCSPPYWVDEARQPILFKLYT